MKIDKKYILVVGTVGVIIITVLLIYCSPFIDADKFGTAADWVSGIATASAFLWGVFAIDKQTNVERALNIEKQRPRFTYERTDNIVKEAIVLLPKGDDKFSPTGIKDWLNERKSGYLFRINNISTNSIYSIEIILKYDGGRTTYKHYGLAKEGTLILVPENLINHWESIWIKFHTSANEIGYMYSEINGETQYYFVKDKNRYVSSYGDDKIITNDYSIVKEFEEIISSNKPSMYTFTAKENIKRNRKETKDTKENKKDK